MYLCSHTLFLNTVIFQHHREVLSFVNSGVYLLCDVTLRWDVLPAPPLTSACFVGNFPKVLQASSLAVMVKAIIIILVIVTFSYIKFSVCVCVLGTLLLIPIPVCLKLENHT